MSTELQPRTVQDLSLYGIEMRLLELLQLREDIADDPDATPAEQQESLKACDESIAEYVAGEVAKCDGIVAMLLEFETRAYVVQCEINRLKLQQEMWEKRHERLKEVTVAALQVAGKTSVQGRTSRLRIQKNPPSVEVRQPQLVPKEMQRVKVTLPLSVYEELLRKAIAAAGRESIERMLVAATETPAEPMKPEIARALKRGDGVPGCELVTDKYSLRVE